MKKHYKILLATDYSEAVMNAERYAVRLAKSTNSTITLLHVYQFPLSATPIKVMDYVKTVNDWRASEVKRLELHRDKLFRSLSINPDEVTCECIIREGSAGQQIHNETKKSDYDFIIVGTHGVTGFRKVFYGTHAWNVIKKSSIPVFAIPKDGLFTGIKHIAFATEYRQGEIPVINFLTRFAKQFNAEITVLHVTNYVLSKQFEAEMFKMFKKEVLEKVSYTKLNIRLIKNENIFEGIEKFCEEKKVDLLVMSPEKPFLMEKIFLPNDSVTREMSFHTDIPLLAIPDFYNPEYSAFWKFFAQGDFVNEDF